MVRISIQSTMFQRFKGAVRISPGFILLLVWFAAGNGWGRFCWQRRSMKQGIASCCGCAGENVQDSESVFWVLYWKQEVRAFPMDRSCWWCWQAPVPTACWPQECGRLIWGVPGQWERLWCWHSSTFCRSIRWMGEGRCICARPGQRDRQRERGLFDGLVGVLRYPYAQQHFA